MKTELRLKPHSIVADRMVIEVWYDDQFIAEVVGLDGRAGVAVISKYALSATRQRGLPHVVQIGIAVEG